MYRAVKDNATNLVLAIGMDEDQGGQDYHGQGTWCDFTFSTIPTLEGEFHHEISGSSIIAVAD